MGGVSTNPDLLILGETLPTWHPVWLFVFLSFPVKLPRLAVCARMAMFFSGHLRNHPYEIDMLLKKAVNIRMGILFFCFGQRRMTLYLKKTKRPYGVPGISMPSSNLNLFIPERFPFQGHNPHVFFFFSRALNRE